MKTSWTAGLSDEHKQEIVDSFKAGTVLRKRLTELLEKKSQTTITNRVQDTEYESPSWAYKQADLGGYLRALNEIISLLET